MTFLELLARRQSWYHAEFQHLHIPACIERATIMMYLHENQEKVEVWKRGWKYNERPKLAEMLNSIGKDKFPNIGRMLTPVYNSLTHGDPESALWNLVQTRDGGIGYSVSKILDNPSLCDKICLEGSTWLLVLTSMTITIFPKATN